MLQTVVLEKTLESPLDSKEIKPVNPKGKQPWIFTGRTDAEAEMPILWPPHMNSRLIGKDSDAGKDWRQEEKGVTEDEMVGWHHWLDGHEFEQALRDGEGQGSLVCCSPWSRRVRNDWVTEQQKQEHMVIFESIGRAFTLIIITTFLCGHHAKRYISIFPFNLKMTCVAYIVL